MARDLPGSQECKLDDLLEDVHFLASPPFLAPDTWEAPSLRRPRGCTPPVKTPCQRRNGNAPSTSAATTKQCSRSNLPRVARISPTPQRVRGTSTAQLSNPKTPPRPTASPAHPEVSRKQKFCPRSSSIQRLNNSLVQNTSGQRNKWNGGPHNYSSCTAAPRPSPVTQNTPPHSLSKPGAKAPAVAPTVQYSTRAPKSPEPYLRRSLRGTESMGHVRNSTAAEAALVCGGISQVLAWHRARLNTNNHPNLRVRPHAANISDTQGSSVSSNNLHAVVSQASTPSRSGACNSFKHMDSRLSRTSSLGCGSDAHHTDVRVTDSFRRLSVLSCDTMSQDTFTSCIVNDRSLSLHESVPFGDVTAAESLGAYAMPEDLLDLASWSEESLIAEPLKQQACPDHEDGHSANIVVTTPVIPPLNLSMANEGCVVNEARRPCASGSCDQRDIAASSSPDVLTELHTTAEFIAEAMVLPSARSLVVTPRCKPCKAPPQRCSGRDDAALVVLPHAPVHVTPRTVGCASRAQRCTVIDDAAELVLESMELMQQACSPTTYDILPQGNVVPPPPCSELQCVTAVTCDPCVLDDCIAASQPAAKVSPSVPKFISGPETPNLSQTRPISAAIMKSQEMSAHQTHLKRREISAATADAPIATADLDNVMAASAVTDLKHAPQQGLLNAGLHSCEQELERTPLVMPAVPTLQLNNPLHLEPVGKDLTGAPHAMTSALQGLEQENEVSLLVLRTSPTEAPEAESPIPESPESCTSMRSILWPRLCSKPPANMSDEVRTRLMSIDDGSEEATTWQTPTVQDVQRYERMVHHEVTQRRQMMEAVRSATKDAPLPSQAWLEFTGLGTTVDKAFFDSLARELHYPDNDDADTGAHTHTEALRGDHLRRYDSLQRTMKRAVKAISHINSREIKKPKKNDLVLTKRGPTPTPRRPLAAVPWLGTALPTVLETASQDSRRPLFSRLSQWCKSVFQSKNKSAKFIVS